MSGPSADRPVAPQLDQHSLVQARNEVKKLFNKYETDLMKKNLPSEKKIELFYDLIYNNHCPRIKY